MFLKDPVVNAIAIYLACKMVIVSVILAYYTVLNKKNKRPKGKAAPDPRRTAAPRLVLTLKEHHNSTNATGREVRNALQHTIEESFSSN
ncbi:hypothetical protein [uncultured Chitinophaga sp.]|jgi:hypothetical protein|uniref:hypothetical protein n=1 Tax=uncultured Chitinophaga sp. TaxID=339340 RepID=UPI00260BF717|nr:hypothetical protein [uncultured Chitinophaga sp.]